MTSTIRVAKMYTRNNRILIWLRFIAKNSDRLEVKNLPS